MIPTQGYKMYQLYPLKLKFTQHAETSNISYADRGHVCYIFYDQQRFFRARLQWCWINVMHFTDSDTICCNEWPIWHTGHNIGTAIKDRGVKKGYRPYIIKSFCVKVCCNYYCWCGLVSTLPFGAKNLAPDDLFHVLLNPPFIIPIVYVITHRGAKTRFIPT